jgi:hypothetical protein
MLKREIYNDKLAKQALETIEGVLNEYSNDLEHYQKNKEGKKETVFYEILFDKLYRYSHGCLKHSCKHPDWIEEMKESHKAYKDMKII